MLMGRGWREYISALLLGACFGCSLSTRFDLSALKRIVSVDIISIASKRRKELPNTLVRVVLPI